jgi:hypothetical protein
VELKWKAPKVEGKIAISKYVITTKQQPSGEEETREVMSVDEKSLQISVAPGAKYKFKVKAVADDGTHNESVLSEIAGGAVLGKLEPPQVKCLGPDSVELKWKAPKAEGNIAISKYVIKQHLQSGELHKVHEEVSADQKSLQVSVAPGAKYKFKVKAVADDARVSSESSFSEIAGGVETEKLSKEKLTDALKAMGKPVPVPPTTAALVARLRGADCFDRIPALREALEAVGGKLSGTKQEQISSLKKKLTEELAKFPDAPPEKQLSKPDPPKVEVIGETLKVTWKAALAESCVVVSYVIKRQLLPSGELEVVKIVPGDVTTTTIPVEPGKKYKFKVEAKTDDAGVSTESSFSSSSGGLVTETLTGEQLKTVLGAMGKTKSGDIPQKVERLRGLLEDDNCMKHMTLEALRDALKAVGGRIGKKQDERIASLTAKLTEELAKFE